MREVKAYPWSIYTMLLLHTLYKSYRWTGYHKVGSIVATENAFRGGICSLVMDLTRWSFKWVYQSMGDDLVKNEDIYLIEMQGLAFGYMIGRPLSSLITKKFFDIFLRDEADLQPATIRERAELKKEFGHPYEKFSVI